MCISSICLICSICIFLYSVDEENISMTKESNFSKLGKHLDTIYNNWGEIGPKIEEKLKKWKNKKEGVKEMNCIKGIIRD